MTELSAADSAVDWGSRSRMEHWATALNQPRVAAQAMLGLDAAYDRIPYFFSDQFDLGMEYPGHVPAGAQTGLVIRGDLPRKLFIAFWVSQGRALAGMNPPMRPGMFLAKARNPDIANSARAARRFRRASEPAATRTPPPRA